MADSENNYNLISEIKNQIYLLYDDLKEFLIPISSSENISQTDDPFIIIKQLKKKLYLLIKEKNKEINELENNIKKLEKDLRYHIKNEFVLKIQKDSSDVKIRSLMEVEEEYEELKEKVRYEQGKFLNNDRKDNEIKILRRENSNLKKAINKLEKKEVNDKETISLLKLDISNNKKKIENMEKEIENLKSQINNNEINENDENNNINLNKSKNSLANININYIGNNKIEKKLKRNLTNYHLGINPINYESLKNANNNNSNKLIILTFDKMNNNPKTKNTLKPLKNHRIKEEMKYKNNSISMRSDENKKYELIGKYAPNNINKIVSNSKIRGLSQINQKIKYNLQNINNNVNIKQIIKDDKNNVHEYPWNK